MHWDCPKVILKIGNWDQIARFAKKKRDDMTPLAPWLCLFVCLFMKMHENARHDPWKTLLAPPHPKKLLTCPLATSFSWHITSWARMWRRMSYLHSCTVGMIWPLGSRWHLRTEPWACCILSTVHSTSTFIISSHLHHHLGLIHILHLKTLLGMAAASPSPSLASCTTSSTSMSNCPLTKPF